ncbi:TPA: hypothetical protein ACXILL_001124 [Serratia marcescens]|nr:hypothetical protein [Serratia marcescens]
MPRTPFFFAFFFIFP